MPEALKQIKAEYDKIVENDVIPLTLGGDHTITYPIMQALAVSLYDIRRYADIREKMTLL